MAICLQNEIVRNNRVPNCPRKSDIEVERCVAKCRYCLGFLLSVSLLGEYQRGVGWPRKSEKITTVVCDYPHLNEFNLRARKAVTCGAEK